MRVAEVDGAGGGGRRPAQRPATKQISQEASLGSMAPARLAHLSRPRSLKDVLALAMLFVGSTIVHVMERTSGFRYLSMAALSVWLTLYVLFVLVTSIWPRSAKAAPQLSDDASA